MKRHSLPVLLAALAFSLPCQAEGSGRAQEIQRVVDGLNSANPVDRIVAFEEAFEKGDATIRQIALDTVFTGNDLTLHSIAVAQILSTKASYVMRISEVLDSNRTRVAEKSAGSFDYRIVNFDSDSGDFLSFSSHSRLDRDTKQPIAHLGNFAGDRMTLAVNLEDMYNLGGLVCHADMRLSETPGVMAGTMTCGGEGNYRVETDLRR